MQEGTPRLTDFGISRILRSDNTSSKHVSGTIAYMPPEAFDGKHSFQTDLWSVGVTFYQMLTGNLPFYRSEQTATMRAIVMDEPEPLPTEIPSAWRNFIGKALAKDRSQRFQTATEMKNAWEAAAHRVFKGGEKLTNAVMENPTQIYSMGFRERVIMSRICGKDHELLLATKFHILNLKPASINFFGITRLLFKISSVSVLIKTAPNSSISFVAGSPNNML